MSERVNIRVKALWDEDGNIMPVSFFWTDGTEYQVDRVLDVVRAASLKVGGVGIRYTVRFSNDKLEIYNKTRYLYLEKGAPPERWFIEAK